MDYVGHIEAAKLIKHKKTLCRRKCGYNAEGGRITELKIVSKIKNQAFIVQTS